MGPGASGSPSLPSEGSVIAYYWSEFSVPKHLVGEAEQALAQEHVVTLPPRARAVSSFVLTSVVAFRECRGAGAGICLAWGRPWTVAGGASSPRASAQERRLPAGRAPPFRAVRKQE